MKNRKPKYHRYTEFAIADMTRERVNQGRNQRSRVLHCSSCTVCELDTNIYTPEEYGIKSSEKPISAVVDATPYCPINESTPSISARVCCPDGNRDRTKVCNNCVHGEPVVCEMKSDNPNLHQFTRLILCKNLSADGQYPKDAALRPYMSCAQFTPK